MCGQIATPAAGLVLAGGLRPALPRRLFQARQDCGQTPGLDALLGQQPGGEAIGFVLETARIAELGEQHRNGRHQRDTEDRSPVTAAPNHNPQFFVDESALVVGTRTLATMVADFLTQKR